jgi:hypothetical protein
MALYKMAFYKMALALDIMPPDKMALDITPPGKMALDIMPLEKCHLKNGT